ncbi:hypothetical protein F4802DRAFT_601695 [Xylaria palmicola]|nr:hypothetical protein F4802DRAFT_601695 [Xylaria palmicola]
MAATSALAQVFPSVGGPFKVQWENKELVDANRVDPFNASHARRMMISHFTPVAERQCAKTCRVPYMPEQIATIEDDILAYAFADYGWPQGLLGGLEVDVCCGVRKPARAAAAKFPTVFFGTGLNTTRLWYTGFATEIASLGYQVIVMDHPYETDVVLFPDGEIIFGGSVPNDPNNLTALEFGLDVRTSDVSFLLDALKISKTVYFGHSFGGASAADATRLERRIKAGLNLDGALWGPVVNAGVSKPFINFSGSLNSSIDDSWKNFYKAQDEKHPRVWGKELHLDKSYHGSFWDLCIIGDFTGLRDNPDLVENVLGELKGKRAVEVLRAYLDDFIKFTLLRGPEGLLAGESTAFPDVHFERRSRDRQFDTQSTDAMTSYQQIKRHFEFNVVPQCTSAIRTVATMNKLSAYKQLTCVRDLVDQVLFEIQKLDARPGSQNASHDFTRSVQDLVLYLDEKIALVYGGPEDPELGLAGDKANIDRAHVAWGWLESGSQPMPKVPGAWPETQ